MPALREKRKPVKPAVFSLNFALLLRMIYALSIFPVIMLFSLNVYFYTSGFSSTPEFGACEGGMASVFFMSKKCYCAASSSGYRRYSVSQLREMYIFYFTVYTEKSFIALQMGQLKCSWDLSGQWQRLRVTVKNLLGLTKALPEITVSIEKVRAFPSLHRFKLFFFLSNMANGF